MIPQPHDIPSRIVVTGPPGSGKTLRLLGLFNDARREGIEDRALFIVPDAPARDHVRDILASHYESDGSEIPSALCDSGIHSFKSLVGKLTSNRIPSTIAGDRHLRALIEKWDSAGDLDSARYPILATPGGIAALARSVLNLRGRGYTADAVDRTGPSQRSPLVPVMRLWESWLVKSGSVDELDVMKIAAKIARETKYALILIDGFTEFQPLQWEIIKTLTSNADFAAVAIDPAQPPASGLLEQFLSIGFVEQPMDGSFRRTSCAGLHWLSDVDCWNIHAQKPENCPCEIDPANLKIIRAADQRIEASCLAREVAKSVSDGYKYADIAILAPNLGQFRKTLASEFRRAGIPIRFYADMPLAETCAGVYIDLVLSVVDGDWSDEKVIGLLSHPYSGLTAEEKDKAIAQTHAKFRLGTKDRWLEWSAGRTKEYLEEIAALTSSAQCDPAEMVSEILSKAGGRIRQSWRAIQDDVLADESWAWERLREELTGAADALAMVSRRTTQERVAEFLRREISEMNARPLDRRRDCVNAVTFLGARTWGVPVVMVAGLARNYFPRRVTPDPFLPDALREAMVPPLPTYDELREREEALFRIAVTRARDRLILTIPAGDFSGNPLLPSGPAEKLIEWLPDGCISSTVVHDPPLDPAEAVFPSDIAAIALENKIPVNTGETQSLSIPGVPNLSDPVCATDYEIAKVSDGRKIVDAACGSEIRPISPSALNHLSQCPYRFFAARVLNLREPDRDRVEAGFDYLQWGTIAHAALAKWVRDGRRGDFTDLIREMAGKQTTITPGSVSEARISQMADVLARFRAFEEEYILNTGFESKYSELVFDTAARRKGHDGCDPARFEIDENTVLTIGGRIDRVDVADNNRAFIIDYKRSKSSINENAIRDANDFQLAFYMILVTEGLGLDVELACFLPLMHIESVGGGKVIYDSAGAFRFDESKFKRTEELSIEAHIKTVRARISELIDGISDGSITPYPRDIGECGSKCPYNDLCRYRFTGEEGAGEDGET